MNVQCTRCHSRPPQKLVMAGEGLQDHYYLCTPCLSETTFFGPHTVVHIDESKRFYISSRGELVYDPGATPVAPS